MATKLRFKEFLDGYYIDDGKKININSFSPDNKKDLLSEVGKQINKLLSDNAVYSINAYMSNLFVKNCLGYGADGKFHKEYEDREKFKTMMDDSGFSCDYPDFEEDEKTRQDLKMKFSALKAKGKRGGIPVTDENLIAALELYKEAQALKIKYKQIYEVNFRLGNDAAKASAQYFDKIDSFIKLGIYQSSMGVLNEQELKKMYDRGEYRKVKAIYDSEIKKLDKIAKNTQIVPDYSLYQIPMNQNPYVMGPNFIMANPPISRVNPPVGDADNPGTAIVPYQPAPWLAQGGGRNQQLGGENPKTGSGNSGNKTPITSVGLNGGGGNAVVSPIPTEKTDSGKLGDNGKNNSTDGSNNTDKGASEPDKKQPLQGEPKPTEVKPTEEPDKKQSPPSVGEEKPEDKTNNNGLGNNTSQNDAKVTQIQKDIIKTTLEMFDKTKRFLEVVNQERGNSKRIWTDEGFEFSENIRERICRIDPAHVDKLRKAYLNNDEATLSSMLNSKTLVKDPKYADRESNYFKFFSDAMNDINIEMEKNGYDMSNMFESAKASTEMVVDREASGIASTNAEEPMDMENAGGYVPAMSEIHKFVNKYTVPIQEAAKIEVSKPEAPKTEVPKQENKKENEEKKPTLNVEDKGQNQELGQIFQEEEPVVEKKQKTKKDGFFKKFGKWLAKSPVVAGTILFTAAVLPLSGILAINSLPAVALYGTLMLFVGKGVKEAIVKPASPRYRRFLQKYDIDKMRPKLETTQERIRQSMKDVDRILGKRKPTTATQTREYIELPTANSTNLSKGAEQTVGYYKSKKALKKTKDRIAVDKLIKETQALKKNVGDEELDLIEGLDASQIKEIIKLGKEIKKAEAQEQKLKTKLEKRYKKVIKGDKNSEWISVDAEEKREMLDTESFAREEDRKRLSIVERVPKGATKRSAIKQDMQEKAKSTEDAVVEQLSKALDSGDNNMKHQVVQYIIKDARKNGGVVNPAYLRIAKQKLGENFVKQHIEDYLNDCTASK